MNLKKNLNNTAISVKLPYNPGHSLLNANRRGNKKYFKNISGNSDKISIEPQFKDWNVSCTTVPFNPFLIQDE